jgi:hypothetical protein
MRFAQAFIIERKKTDNRLWQPYELSFAPRGTAQTSWHVELVLGFSGELQRVQLFFGPPPPS